MSNDNLAGVFGEYGDARCVPDRMSSKWSFPTKAFGITFRSRTEARWAMVFNELTENWAYEPELFKFREFWYKPDFYLYDYETFVEVKPDHVNKTEARKILNVCVRTNRHVLLLRGNPSRDIQKCAIYHKKTGGFAFEHRRFSDECCASGGLVCPEDEYCDTDWCDFSKKNVFFDGAGDITRTVGSLSAEKLLTEKCQFCDACLAYMENSWSSHGVTWNNVDTAATHVFG